MIQNDPPTEIFSNRRFIKEKNVHVKVIDQYIIILYVQTVLPTAGEWKLFLYEGTSTIIASRIYTLYKLLLNLLSFFLCLVQKWKNYERNESASTNELLDYFGLL